MIEDHPGFALAIPGIRTPPDIWIVVLTLNICQGISRISGMWKTYLFACGRVTGGISSGFHCGNVGNQPRPVNVSRENLYRPEGLSVTLTGLLGSVENQVNRPFTLSAGGDINQVT